MTEETAEPTHLSPWWRHATILVMIAGFSVLGLPSLAEVKAWAERYAAILDGNEVDVRLMVEGAGFLA